MPKQVQGLWIPDSEVHLIPYLERGQQFAGGATYQFQKFALAFPFIENFRHAVDVGAHCGLWTRVLSHCFAGVTAFEPLEVNRECFVMNIRSAGVRLHDCAIGNQNGSVALEVPSECTGWSFVTPHGSVHAPMRTLEQKPGHADRYGLRSDQAVTLLKSWGAEIRFELDGDYIMSW